MGNQGVEPRCPKATDLQSAEVANASRYPIYQLYRNSTDNSNINFGISPRTRTLTGGFGDRSAANYTKKTYRLRCLIGGEFVFVFKSSISLRIAVSAYATLAFN